MEDTIQGFTEEQLSELAMESIPLPAEAAPSKMKIHAHSSVDGQYYFTINARNGQVMLTSETYKRVQNVEKAIRTFRKNVKELEVIRHYPFK